MAQWWELAIPALAGIVGGWGAAWLHIRDTRQARKDARFLDERRDAYARLLRTTRELEEANRASDQAGVALSRFGNPRLLFGYRRVQYANLLAWRGCDEFS